MTSEGIAFLETLKNPANLFKNNLNNTRNLKSQIPKKRKNGGIVELLIPTYTSHEETKTFLGKKNMGRLF